MAALYIATVIASPRSVILQSAGFESNRQWRASDDRIGRRKEGREDDMGNCECESGRRVVWLFKLVD